MPSAGNANDMSSVSSFYDLLLRNIFAVRLSICPSSELDIAVAWSRHWGVGFEARCAGVCRMVRSVHRKTSFNH